MTCSDFLKELTDYLDETLDDRTKAELDEHLAWCHNCFVVCNTTKKTIEIYRDSELYELPENLRANLSAMPAEPLRLIAERALTHARPGALRAARARTGRGQYLDVSMTREVWRHARNRGAAVATSGAAVNTAGGTSVGTSSVRMASQATPKSATRPSTRIKIPFGFCILLFSPYHSASFQISGLIAPFSTPIWAKIATACLR